MAWLAVDVNGNEWIFEDEPYRSKLDYEWYCDMSICQLSSGSIRKLIGRDLTWEDEAVEI